MPRYILFLSLLPVIGALFSESSHAQLRDMRAERFVMDDDGDGGTLNTMALQAPELDANREITFPDPGEDASVILSTSSEGQSIENGLRLSAPGSTAVEISAGALVLSRTACVSGTVLTSIACALVDVADDGTTARATVTLPETTTDGTLLLLTTNDPHGLDIRDSAGNTITTTTGPLDVPTFLFAGAWKYLN